jgi:hypothetical protein
MYCRLTLILMLALALAGCGATGQTQTQGDLSVTLETSPSTPLADRPTTIRIQLQRAGQPLDSANVAIVRAMPGMEHDADQGRLIAQPLGGGRYEALTAFSMGSRWNLSVAVSVADEQPQVVTFPLDVEQP